MTRPFAAAILAVLSVGVSACGSASRHGPPEIRLGIDTCDHCGMAIDEPRYAAAVLVGDDAQATVFKFDDLGCLALWEAGAHESTIRGRWVHDRRTQTWIDASSATFVVMRDLTTPMGSGVAAFAARADAEAFAMERGGEALSWTTVLTRAGDGSLTRHGDSQRKEAR